MLIPKSFQDGYDFETMLLTSILGTFISLKEDLISYAQAESYWLSDLTAEIFEELSLSKEIIQLIQKGTELKDYEIEDDIFNEKIDVLISESKALISKHYTEYNEINKGIIN